MATAPKNPTEAQALKAKREADGKKAMAEYEANAEAVRAKTEKLRALRLARDAAMPQAAPKAVKAKSSTSKSGGKSAKSKKADPGKLSDWIKNQQNSGHNY
ncbi:hypothetical protein [Rhodoplanes sp. Z2-YC6860]|uniref:hypothetical protein n=1 Tax=Rhodoplanes sp. Z2-YC6860 TaxID=674703 RepID=UPI0008310BFA|nr:hypothetical protein [Rhodoplanes sp. Z2-YC6860]